MDVRGGVYNQITRVHSEFLVRGRGFEPLNPYGTRFPNTSLDVPELRVHMVRWVSRAFDLASPSAWFGSLAVGSYA